MNITTAQLPNSVPVIRQRTASGRVTWFWPLAMLPARTFLFLFWQFAWAVLLAITGAAHPFTGAIAWWPITVVLASLTTLALLFWLFRREGMSYRALLAIDRSHIKADILLTLGLLAVSGVLTTAPNLLAAKALFGDPNITMEMMFRELPRWAALFSLVVFPISVALSELPTYFGYCMPRLEALSGRAWLAVVLPSFFLAAQHMAFPFIPDWRFLTWRLLMFLPFALFVGICLHWRPRLLPYFMVGHALIDFPVALLVLNAAS